MEKGGEGRDFVNWANQIRLDSRPEGGLYNFFIKWALLQSPNYKYNAMDLRKLVKEHLLDEFPEVLNPVKKEAATREIIPFVELPNEIVSEDVFEGFIAREGAAHDAYKTRFEEERDRLILALSQVEVALPGNKPADGFLLRDIKQMQERMHQAENLRTYTDINYWTDQVRLLWADLKTKVDLTREKPEEEEAPAA